MPRNLRIEYPGALYHVTCRGNQRMAIFRYDADYQRLLVRLAESIETYGIRLYLYCLMPNHAHLVFATPKPNLSRFMQSWLTGYTLYFNTRHDQCGHLFQGRFNASLVDGDKYLLVLSRYVHLNPVHVKEVEKMSLEDRIKILRQYRWSSYPAYIGHVKVPEWLKTGPVLAQVGGTHSNVSRTYQRYVEIGLAESGNEFNALIHSGKPWIGGDSLERKYKEQARIKLGRLKRPEDVNFRPEMDTLDSATIMKHIAELMGCKVATGCRLRGDLDYKGLVVKALKCRTLLTNREIAPLLGLKSGAAVSWQERRINALIMTKTKVQYAWEKIETALARMATPSNAKN